MMTQETDLIQYLYGIILINKNRREAKRSPTPLA